MHGALAMDSLFQAAASKIGASSLDGLEKGFQALQKDAQFERPSEPESDSEDSSSSCNIEEAAASEGPAHAAKEDPYEVPSSPDGDLLDLASSSSSASDESPAPSGLSAETARRLREEGDQLNYSALRKMLTDSLPPADRPKRDNKIRPRGGKKITEKKRKKKLREQMEKSATAKLAPTAKSAGQMEKSATAESASAKSAEQMDKSATAQSATAKSASATAKKAAPCFAIDAAAFSALGLPLPPPPLAASATPSRPQPPAVPSASATPQPPAGPKTVAAPAAPQPPAVPKRCNLSASLGVFQSC